MKVSGRQLFDWFYDDGAAPWIKDLFDFAPRTKAQWDALAERVNALPLPPSRHGVVLMHPKRFDVRGSIEQIDKWSLDMGIAAGTRLFVDPNLPLEDDDGNPIFAFFVDATGLSAWKGESFPIPEEVRTLGCIAPDEYTQVPTKMLWQSADGTLYEHDGRKLTPVTMQPPPAFPERMLEHQKEILAAIDKIAALPSRTVEMTREEVEKKYSPHAQAFARSLADELTKALWPDEPETDLSIHTRTCREKMVRGEPCSC